MNTTTSAGIGRLLGLALSAIASLAFAEPPGAGDTTLSSDATAVPTFHSIGLYWTPHAKGSTTLVAPTGNAVKIRYAKVTDTAWKDGHDMWYDARALAGRPKEARGSIVMLEPNTQYIVQLGLPPSTAGGSITWVAEVRPTTWSEDFPIASRADDLTWSGTRGPAAADFSTSNYPAGGTRTGSRRHLLHVTRGGSQQTGYVLYDFTGLNAIGKALQQDTSTNPPTPFNNADDFCVVISADYVIVRGLRCIGGGRGSIWIDPGHNHIVIEDSDISQWDQRWSPGNTVFFSIGDTKTDPSGAQYIRAVEEGEAGIVVQPDANAYGSAPTSAVVIQRCKIHNPLYGADPWEFEHPLGPTGILMYPTGGNHVIRYNEFYSTKPNADGSDSGYAGAPNYGHFFEDVAVLGGDNFDNVGSPGPNSDIYQNIIMHGMDDGLEIEGGGMNVRVWGNYVDYTATGLASTPVVLGPVYFWRNVYNRSRARYDVEWGSDIQTGTGRLGFFKAGSDPSFGGGRRYIYHNTGLEYPNPNGKACDAAAAGCPLGEDYGINGTRDHDANNNVIEQPLTNTVSRNNILESAKGFAHQAINIGHTTVDADDLDYDATNASSMGSWVDSSNVEHTFNEPQGKTGNAIVYKVEADGTKHGPLAEWRGLYQLDSTSPGYHNGTPIPNFNDVPDGSIDRGAHQNGTSRMLFGLAAAGMAAPDLADASDTGVSSTDNLTKDDTPTFNGTAASGSTVQIFDGTTLLGSVTATNGAYSFTPSSALAQGTHSITAKVGSVQSSALTVIIDTAAPSTAAITAPTNGSTVSGPTTVTASTDTTGVYGVQFRLDGALLQPEDITPPYSINWDTTTTANGPHTLTAEARDAADNKLTSPAITVTVSNGGTTLAPPSTPDLAAASDSGTSNTDNVTNVATPTFTGTATAGTTVNLYSDGAQVGSGPITGGAYSITLATALTEGPHNITAKATDGTNTSAASGTLSVVVDRTAPATSISAPASGASLTGTVAVTANATDANTVVGVQFKLDGAALQAEDTASPYSINWDTTTAANGSHTLTAVGRDTAGNAVTSASVTVTVNNTASPELNVSITPQNTTILSNATGEHVDITVSSSQALASVSFYVNNVLQATDTAAPYSFSWSTAGQTPGNYAFKVEATDGTTTRTETRPFTIIATTCEIYANPGAAPQGTAIQLQGVCSGSKNVADVQFLVDDVPQASDPSSAYTATIDTSRLSVGTHTVAATGRFASPAGQASASRTIDVQLPTLAADLTPGSVVLYDERITFTAKVNDGRQLKQVDFYLDGVFKGGVTVAPYEYTWTPAGIADLGRHTMVVQATDASNNMISTTRDVLLLPRTCSVQLGNSRYRQAGSDTVYAGSQKVAQGERVSVRSECSAWVSINRVEFYLNGVLQNTTTDAPYAWSVDTSALAVGQSYTVSTKGYLTNGLVSNDAVTIEIVAP